MDQQPAPKQWGKPFQPGQSGNPSGRPKVTATIKSMAREAAPMAFQKVIDLLQSEDERVAFVAAQEILNRAYGKPTQYLDVTERRDVADLSDDELVSIATASRDRVIEAQASKAITN